eukprot:TRINITY_DN7624_c0_g1_i1.p1 TRINITY_DN7624_c0_g1~~TRINITY_DN7624_c0_g1_i1.p1  ORF type:complete len:132 (-),score=19.60 TRINITY_DN7624_c0_g1_i1:171-566(-)
MIADAQDEDEIYLCNIYSSWDYLNDEKNEGKVHLSQFHRYCEKLGVNVTSYQKASNNPQSEFVQEIRTKKVEVFYLGETAFTQVASDENVVFQFFSWVKKQVVGTMAKYLKKKLSAHVQNCCGKGRFNIQT